VHLTGLPTSAAAQGGLALDAHVLLAAECPAVLHQLDLHSIDIPPQNRSDLPAVVEYALSLAQHFQAGLAVGTGHRNGDARLRLQEHVLDPLRVERIGDDMGGSGQRRLRVPAMDRRFGEQISVGMNFWRLRF